MKDETQRVKALSSFRLHAKRSSLQSTASTDPAALAPHRGGRQLSDGLRRGVGGHGIDDPKWPHTARAPGRFFGSQECTHTALTVIRCRTQRFDDPTSRL